MHSSLNNPQTFIIHLGLFFVLGAIVGSFLNVCIYRMPRKRSVVFARSACIHCRQPIPWKNNIPILSWIYLRGRTACCKKRIPFRYLFVETTTALLFAACSVRFPAPNSLIMMIFCSILICASIIDLEHLLIPDSLTLGGTLLGLALSTIFPSVHQTGNPILGFIYSLQGLLIASSSLLWIGLVAEWMLRKEAVGFGDVKLLGLFGAFLGWESGLWAIFGGACLGSLFFVTYCLVQRVHTLLYPAHPLPKLHLKSRVPFAPFLSLSTLLYVFFFQDSFKEYLRNFWTIVTNL